MNPVFTPKRITTSDFLNSNIPEDEEIKVSVAKSDYNYLREAIARVLSTDDGKLMLEHLLDISLRAEWPSPLIEGASAMERYALACATRKGQNRIVQHLLNLAAQGQGEQGFFLNQPL